MLILLLFVVPSTHDDEDERTKELVRSIKKYEQDVRVSPFLAAVRRAVNRSEVGRDVSVVVVAVVVVVVAIVCAYLHVNAHTHTHIRIHTHSTHTQNSSLLLRTHLKCKLSNCLFNIIINCN